MKTKFSRRAKSALSIFLTLCMVLSVFTIAISSASAATAEDESVGADTTYYYMGKGVTGAEWGSGKAFTSLGDNFYYIEKTNSGEFKITESASNYDVQYTTIDNSCGDLTLDGGDSNNITDTTDSTHYIMFFKSGNVNKIWSVSKNPSTYQYFKTWADALINGNGQESRYGKVFFNNAEANWTGNIYLVIGHDTWLRVHKMTALDGTDLYNYNLTDSGGFNGAKYYTFFSTSSELSNNYPSGTSKQKKLYELMADESDKITNVSTGYVLQSSSSVHFQNNAYTYSYKPTATGSYQAFNFEQSNSSPGDYFNKTQTVNVYTNGVAETTGGSVSYSGYRVKSDGTETALTSDQNYPALTSEFTITATPATNFTFDGFYSDAALTQKITTGVSGNAYTYTVEDTKTVYANFVLSDPVYCVVGNLLTYNAILVDQNNDGEFEEPNVTEPSGDNTYFNTWQENLKFAIPVEGEPGKYRFKVRVKNDYSYNGDNTVKLCIYLKNVGQKAFIYNDTPYNTASNDLTVPDSGISSGLYVYDLASSSAGGSLVLKAGQTYTITIDQRSYYNNDTSNPPGSITITTTDAFVDTVAKKKNYNATDRQYDSASDASTAIGTASSSPYHGTKGFTSTLSATPVNSNYTFTGWYSDAACTTQVYSAAQCTESDGTYTKNVTASESTTYYALFTQNQPDEYAVTVTNPTGGTVTLTGTAVDDGKAYAGATVGLSLNNVERGKEFKSWKITSTQSGYDVTSSVLNAGATASSASFTMPPYGVTVTAVLGAKTPVSVTATSNDNALGTASAASGTFYVGDEIQLTAANVGGVFTKWQITGANFKSGSTATTQNPTIIPTGTTVTAKAFFDYKTYQLYYKGSKKLPMIRQSDGTYVSTYDIDNNDNFTIYDVKEDKYAQSEATGTSWYVNDTDAVNISSWGSYEKYYYSNTGSRKYVKFDPAGNSGTGTVQLIATNPMGDIAKIYAKDGSIRYFDTNYSSGDLWEASTGGTTCNRGVTVVTKIDNTTVTDPDYAKYPSTDLSNHLKVYSAPIGSTITIQTTINAAYNTQGFEVGMFVVNGWKVAATKTGDGIYTATYTLSDEYDVENLDSQKSFEITPVYYNKNFKYITFYVDAASVPSKWKGTISACANYQGATNAHFEGTYPGQPLGREGDLYELKIAKYYYQWDSSNSKWTAQTNYYPNATITAYNFDLVHHYYYVKASDEIYESDNNNNYQTYDYADFGYLSQIKDIEAVLFRCKYETSKSNRTYCGTSATRPSDSNVNGYQLLTDYYGNPIDALGNRIDNGSGGYYTAEDVANNPTDWEVADAQIKIVSCGNISNDKKKSDSSSDVAYKNWRTKGNWITAWKVFDATGTASTHIAVGSPADFVNTKANTTDTAVYNFTYASGKSSSNLSGKKTFISYERELDNDSSLSGETNTGIRIDGQWYYSAMHEFTSNVKVATTTGTATTLTISNTTLEVDSNSANNTGYIGTTSGTKATLDDKTTATYNNTTTNAELECTLGTGYTFVGWYVFDGSTYTKIGDNYADLNTTMQMKKNYTIVAVVKEVGSGDLVITHSRYTGSKPEAHTGTGKYYVSAVINRVGVNNPIEIDEAQNSITIPSVLATDKITIKLRTVCDGADTFYAWYEEALGENYARTGNYYEICDENKDPLGESQVSYEFFQADCSTFFNGDTLTRKTLDFYSDIIHVSAYANLTYKYYDRFKENGEGNMVSYTVKNVPLSNAEIENGYIPGDDKITKYAPNVVDTIYTDTKWYVVGTKVERMASNVTLMATQEDKECYVQYIPYDNVGEELLQDLSTETGVGDVAEWTNTKVPFNSWLVNGEKDMSNWDPSDFIVSAPQTYSYTSGGTTTTWTFVRFDVYAANRTSGAIGDLIYSSNDNIFGYRIYADCAIYPVYEKAEVTKQLTAKIEPAVLNREVYGDSTNPTDRLYADLIISFMNLTAVSDGPTTNVIKEIESTSGFTIETGVILDKSVNLSFADYNTLKTAGAAKGTDTTATVIASYNTLIGTEHVTALAANDTAYTGLAKYKVKDNSDMTNKNRIDKVLKFTNSTTSGVQEKVYFAYSYIVIKKDGNVIATAISAPQKFNFAYIGNKPLETVSGS